MISVDWGPLTPCTGGAPERELGLIDPELDAATWSAPSVSVEVISMPCDVSVPFPPLVLRELPLLLDTRLCRPTALVDVRAWLDSQLCTEGALVLPNAPSVHS